MEGGEVSDKPWRLHWTAVDFNPPGERHYHRDFETEEECLKWKGGYEAFNPCFKDIYIDPLSNTPGAERIPPMTTPPETKPCPCALFRWANSDPCSICNDTLRISPGMRIPNPNPWRDIATDPPKDGGADSNGLCDFLTDDGTAKRQWKLTESLGSYWAKWRHTQSWLDAHQKEVGEPETAESYARKSCPSETPAHYNKPVTPWDLQRHMESSGNCFVDSRRTDAIEYCFRMKGDLLGDLKKARHCIDEAIKTLST